MLDFTFVILTIMPSKLYVLLLYISTLVPVLASGLAARTTSFSNSTATKAANSTGPAPSNCCFVVQDTVDIYWWQKYTTAAPFYKVVNVTSITTVVTPYHNTTVISYSTNVHLTNTTFQLMNQLSFNSASLLINDTPKPFQTNAGLNGSQTVTAAAFWVYSSVKIITAAAVTNSNGDAVCVITSIAPSTTVETFPPFTAATTTYPEDVEIRTYALFYISRGASTSNIFTISGINSNVEAYFGGYNISGVAGSTIAFVTGYRTDSAVTYTETDGSVTTFSAEAETLGPYSSLYAYSDGGTFAYNDSTATASAITFLTPYIYLPSHGAMATQPRDYNDVCYQAGGNENYGYVPQSVIDYMAKVPAISSQYPGIESCLPGGPSIIHKYFVLRQHPQFKQLEETSLQIPSLQSQQDWLHMNHRQR
ncbi:hypothetical protein G7Y89_g6266 [Cudoniella acicularis]|uniref:Uncharacterized protein n=1 Tax=Cudoniella acicularis TaxID=354080 RepID=A0A8H4RN95_9HELO|nr:hypothetical protein G7Y89_g6266 [Cudoniella acicularis]